MPGICMLGGGVPRGGMPGGGMPDNCMPGSSMAGGGIAPNHGGKKGGIPIMEAGWGCAAGGTAEKPCRSIASAVGSHPGATPIGVGYIEGPGGAVAAEASATAAARTLIAAGAAAARVAEGESETGPGSALGRLRSGETAFLGLSSLLLGESGLHAADCTTPFEAPAVSSVCVGGVLAARDAATRCLCALISAQIAAAAPLSAHSTDGGGRAPPRTPRTPRPASGTSAPASASASVSASFAVVATRERAPVPDPAVFAEAPELRADCRLRIGGGRAGSAGGSVGTLEGEGEHPLLATADGLWMSGKESRFTYLSVGGLA
eukprot:6213723-Pleurochrysis_carterae.AAC.2